MYLTIFQNLFRAFISILDDYALISESDRAIFETAAKDPAKRRETKTGQEKAK